MTHSLAHPLPPDWTVRRGLDAFLLENGYREDEYDAPRTPVRLFGVSFGIPNTPRHRWAIKRHDLHHIATGYGTDLIGEGELAAWEFARGIRPVGLYVGAIITSGLFLGLIRPQRTRRAWRAGRSARGSTLFHHDAIPYEALLAMSIADLRELLRIPPTGLANHPRGLNPRAPREFSCR